MFRSSEFPPSRTDPECVSCFMLYSSLLNFTWAITLAGAKKLQWGREAPAQGRPQWGIVEPTASLRG
eukprot:3625414-Alexandrium_andersonii.AAC.1